jgi:hypothetical protein
MAQENRKRPARGANGGSKGNSNITHSMHSSAAHVNGPDESLSRTRRIIATAYLIDDVRTDAACLADGLAHLAGRLGDGGLARLALRADRLAYLIHVYTVLFLVDAERGALP